MKYLIAAALAFPLASCVTSGDLAEFEQRTAQILADTTKTSEMKLAEIGGVAEDLAATVEDRTKNVLSLPFSSGNPIADLIFYGIGLTGLGVGTTNKMRNNARIKRGEKVGTA